MKNDCIFFVQKRTGKSGAPVALSRLLRHPEILKLNPLLIVSQQGWLTEQCLSSRIPCLIQPFPSSRSLSGLLWKNRSFAKKIMRRLDEQNLRPRLVIGNDHLEGILTDELSKALHIPSVLFLRSSETVKKDYFKYRCHLPSLRYTVGPQLLEQIASWDSSSPTRLLYDGLYEENFFPPKSIAPSFPSKILVVGSESHYKGWQDFSQAIDQLEKDPRFPSLEFDFTGTPPDPKITDMQLGKNRRSKFNFIGRVENFSQFVRNYDLVIHPSREEAFGLAMIEILAAGVPLFCSHAGVIEQIQKNAALLFKPHNPNDLAEKLMNLFLQWSAIDFDLEKCQHLIRNKFMMDHIITDLSRNLAQLTLPSS